MKTALYWLMFLILVGLQVVVGQSFGGGIFAIPLCAVALVVMASFISTEQLLYMALAGGLVLDISSGNVFGFNIIFLLFVALFCKLAVRMGQRDQELMTIILLGGLMTLLYSFIQFVMVFKVDQLNIISIGLMRFGREILISFGWGLILYYLALSINKVKFTWRNNRLWAGWR